MTPWYHTGGRRARTRIAAREWREVEREKQRATTIEPEPTRLTWPDRGLGWLWGEDMVPNDLAATCSELMEAGVRGEEVRETAARMEGAGLKSPRRRLGKRLRRASVPSPSKWMALGQLLGACELILTRGEKARAAAKEVSLPTSSRLSELLHNHTRLRISDLSDLPSPQWRAVVERWWGEWA